MHLASWPWKLAWFGKGMGNFWGFLSHFFGFKLLSAYHHHRLS